MKKIFVQLIYLVHRSSKNRNCNIYSRYKRSKLERQVNKDVIGCFVILLCLCTFGAVGNVLWSRLYEEPAFFMWEFASNTFDWSSRFPSYDGFILFWLLIIIFQVIIPQSLYVTLEMTKLIQVYLVQQDLQLYDEDCDKTIECRALNIPEELGQVRALVTHNGPGELLKGLTILGPS